MFGTSNNLFQKTAWPEPRRNNEIIFQLPSAFNVGNTIVTKGLLMQDKERLRIGLTRGSNNSGNNFLFYIIFDFIDDEITIVRNENGLLVEEEKVSELSQLCPDSEFIFHIRFKENDRGELLLATMLGGFGFDDVNLQSKTEILDSQENIFLTVQEDSLKIQEIQFVWE